MLLKNSEIGQMAVRCWPLLKPLLAVLLVRGDEVKEIRK